MEMATDEMSRVPASRSEQSHSRITQVWDVLGQPKGTLGEFPGGPVVKNPPSNSGDDQPTWHIKKHRHYFANKGLSSQTYGFSSSHVWM